MKILSVKGKNIRSLFGDFELNFYSSPFLENGLFAIVGPTGAGKSTILDTICLALYGRCPRIEDMGSRTIIDDISGEDPRTALSRGALEGIAEVVFETSGHIYRAKWHVYKARKSRKIQAVKRDVIDETINQIIASGITDTDKKIEEITGLNFNQFKRSVLLAQGDFSAFLKAKEDERAKLLETITGLDVYTALSKRAHEKAKDIKKQIEQLSQNIKRIEKLSEEDIIILNNKLASLTGYIMNTDKEIETAQKQIKWYEEYKKLEDIYNKSSDYFKTIQKSYEESISDREYIVKVQKARDIRAELEQYENLRNAINSDNLKLNEIEKEKEKAGTIFKYAQKNLIEEAYRFNEEKKRYESLKPEIQKSRELDIQLKNSIEKANFERQKWQNACKDFNDIETHLKAQTDRLRELERKLASVVKWLEEQEALKNIESEWSYWKDKIIEFSKQKELIDIYENKLKELSIDKEKYEELKNKLLSEEGILSLKLNELSENQRKIETEIELNYKGSSPEAISKVIICSSEGKQIFDNIITQKQEITKLTNDIYKTISSKDEAKKILDEAYENKERLTKENNKILILLEKYRKNLDHIQKALSLEDIRNQLKSGEECPLCGSTNHPYILQNAPEKNIEILEKKRVNELEQNTNNIEKEIIKFEKDIIKQSERIRYCEDTIKKNNEIMNFRRSELDKQNNQLQIKLEHLDIITIDDDLGEKLLQINNDAKNIYNNGLLLQKKINKIITDINQFREKKDKIKEDISNILQKNISIDHELRDSSKLLIQKKQEQAHIICDMSPVFIKIRPSWEKDLKHNTKIFLQDMASEVKNYKIYAERYENIKNQKNDAEKDFAFIQFKFNELSKNKSELENSFREADENFKAIKKSRNLLIGGRETIKFEKELEQNLKVREENYQKAQNESNDKEVQLRKIEILFDEQKYIFKKRETEFLHAKEKFTDAVKKKELNEEDLKKLVAIKEDDIDKMMARIKEIEDLLSKSKIEMFQRQQDLFDYRQSEEKPSDSLEKIIEYYKELIRRKDEFVSDLDEMKLKERENKKKQEEFINLQIELTTIIDKGDRWLKIDDLIGHADGATFRKFAQILTLNQLIILANDQLLLIYPRYLLYTPDPVKLDIGVIDKEQASEKRSISTLSGGETFIVSLALSLALARLSSRQAKIQTLFIDEGFGSLDPNTLDEVLATLDMLRSEGKTIGLISHVPALQERISCQVKVIPTGGGRSRLEVLA
ncbi:MAG: AAA family ATPase [Desulfobacterales bacterium]|nr:AAA family ATPase [Desulfobacterales bacterium]